MKKIKDRINNNIEDVVKLYFKGYSVKEAIEIIRERSIKKKALCRGHKIKKPKLL